MPQPNEHHARLAAMAGRFLGEETMLPSQWVPEGTTASATIVNQSSLGGFVLVQDYEQRRDGEVVFQGHGVFWIDAHSGEVRLTWWDGMGMAPNEFRGGWEGERLVLHSKSPMGHTRTTWTPGEGSCTHTMETSQDGQRWSLLMEGSYRRQA